MYLDTFLEKHPMVTFSLTLGVTYSLLFYCLITPSEVEHSTKLCRI